MGSDGDGDDDDDDDDRDNKGVSKKSPTFVYPVYFRFCPFPGFGDSQLYQPCVTRYFLVAT
jgi:hypothetical protein